MSSKRHSILPPVSQSGPKPPVHFSSPSITISDSALLTGTHPISIASDSVIHPRARLDSLRGRVTIGRRCVVHERATVGSSSSTSLPSSSPPPPPSSGRINTTTTTTAESESESQAQSQSLSSAAAVTLGDYVVVEVGAAIEAGDTVIGEGTTVGVGARVGAGAVIGKHCTLTPYTEIAPREVVPDFTVVYSNGMRRTDRRGVAELKNTGLARQIDVLRRMIPSNPAKFV
ncbi:hypothetical protein VTK56DRAFT_2842 [Thermocarpiscus australiensis]